MYTKLCKLLPWDRMISRWTASDDIESGCWPVTVVLISCMQGSLPYFLLVWSCWNVANQEIFETSHIHHEREREWYFSWYYYWGIKVIIALSWIYGSPIIYLSGFCTSTLTSPFVFRSFASELQVESWRASVGLSCHLVKTLLSMGVARLPGFDYYQCRLPTSDALPDLNELTFVSCICLGKLNWGMQMFEF